MITTSSDFQTAAKATVRQVKAKVDIIWTSPTEDSSITVSGATAVEGFINPNGIDQYGDIPLTTLGNTFSIGFTYADLVISGAPFIARSNTPTKTFIRALSTGALNYTTITGNYIQSSASKMVNSSSFKTVVITCNITTQSFAMYFEGAEDTGMTVTGTLTAETFTSLFLFRYLTNYYGMKLKNFKIWNKVLSAAEALAYHNGTFDALDQQVWYKCNERSGNLTDSSGNGNTAIVYNPTTSFYNSTVINDINRAANINQIYDGNSDIPKRWMHLDGIVKADGTYKLMPDPLITSTFREQVGWYGKVQCGSAGTWEFTTDPQLIVEFDARPVISLFVAGDTFFNEYPVDFTIKLYAGVTLEHTETITANTLVKWSKNVSDQALASITKMILTISKWSTANRIVKISEFYTAFFQTFEGDEIVSMNLLEERVIGDGSLPIGNISSNELDLTLNNVAITAAGAEIIDSFFPGNAASIYYELIRKNRRVEPYLGFLLPSGAIEYVKLGVFWTGDWTVNEQDYTASVSCRDRMELLRKAEYDALSLFENATLYDIMESVLNYARTNIPMSTLEWQIDEELRDFIIPQAWFPKQDYFKTIKQIVEACMGQAYMSKSDVLIIEGPSALNSESPTLTFDDETLTFGGETLTF